ncbi:Linear gramicidin synthase subunit D [Pseudoalteromonas sp. P1-9]|uniref:non-ribosomal peptide synthetase n=1 Tax=Pseudoalteromonas sp. P1-9 TaxID=1710354 RepID=UPI0006D613D1|nr:non-ribosomal peptide synthetase [Pseudoalteromonas sp. P1-9]KPV93711.1 Linear gramicidin synthase subunit D [Pseudoalteromonas sp. P1-9]
MIVFFEKLKSLDIRILLDDNGKLKVQGKKENLTAELLGELKANKQELINWLSQDIKPRYEEIDRIERLNQPFKTSFSQQRLWFIDQLQQGSAEYNLPAAFEVNGTFSVEVAEEAFGRIIERHESLRTVFLQPENEVLQRILTEFEFKIKQVNLATLPDHEQRIQAQSLAVQDATKVFNLQKDLMLRASYLRFSQSSGVLLFNMHHIASDGWSIAILVNEFIAEYEAIKHSKPSPVPELTIQYVDYAYWQHDWLKTEKLENQLNYWLDNLADVPALHSIPTDFKRPLEQTFVGDKVDVSLPVSIAERLNALAQSTQSTLFMIIHAAFSLTLAQFSHNDDIVIGTPVANRMHKSLENLIGFFVNTLTLRADLSGQPTFSELLEQIKKVNLGAQANQDIPFDYLVEQLNPQRSTSYSPLFQITLEMNTNAESESTETSFELSPFGAMEVTTKYDLTLFVFEGEQGLTLSFTYNKALFNHHSISTLACYVKKILREVAFNPHISFEQMMRLTEQDTKTLSSQHGKSTEYLQTTPTLLEAFQRHTKMSPDALAVKFAEGSMSYSELNKKSSQLAEYLIDNSIGMGNVIGVCLPRSFDLLIALLAVLKSGNAYLALEPSLPSERLRFMLEDSAASLLLTDRSESNAWYQETGCQVIALDSFAVEEAYAHYSDTESQLGQVEPDDIAYYIYTSGSTGKPKGVGINHKGLINYLLHTKEHYFDKGILQGVVSSPLNFDATVTTLWGPLVAGKTVSLATNREDELLVDLVAKIKSEPPSVFKITPAHIDAIQPMFDGVVTTPHRFVIGGEQLTGRLLSQFRLFLPNGYFVNEYGPTETVVGCSVYEVVPQTEIDTNRSIPIGRPIQNTRLYVVGKAGQVVPPGSVGELVIGGDGVANGYLNRQQLSDEKFINDNLSDEENGRLYRSGDLVRSLASGDLEYLGRADEQIKIRGFRIEPGEIENQLIQQPLVSNAVVLAQKINNGSKQLIAYVTVETDEENITTKLTAELKKSLPDYMVPSQIVILDEMPITQNGKIAKQKLRLPENYTEKTSFVAPVNEIQMQLCDIWQQVIGVEKIGITDNFFALGGDSILSIQVVSRANKVGISITTRQIFLHQTVEQLSQHVNQGVVKDRPQEETSGTQELLPIQHGFLHSEGEPENHFNQSVLLSIPPELGLAQLTLIFEALVKRHDVLRLRFTQQEKRWSAHYVDSAKLNWQDCIAEATLPEDQSRWPKIIESLSEDCQRALNLSNGPLFKAQLFRGQHSSRLLIVVHHIVVDGVSWRIILKDLEMAVNQILDHSPLTLEEKSSSYAQWGAALNEFANSETLLSEKSFWEQQLPKEEKTFPVDRESDTTPDLASSESIMIQLSESQTEKLLKECPKVYRTHINELLLSAVCLGLYKWRNIDDVTVMLEGHGREELFEHLDLSETVGWFTTMYPVKLENKEIDAGSIIKTVKEQIRAIPNNGIGFGVLTHLAAPESFPNKSTSADVPILFNYLGQFDQVAEQNERVSFASENSGTAINPSRKREYLLALNGMVAGGRLNFSVDYSVQQYEFESIKLLAQSIELAFVELIEHCLEKEKGEFTPSDFPLAKVTTEQLNIWQSSYELDKLYPATSMQQGMQFHSSIEKGAYITQMVLQIEGELHITNFRQAWQSIIERHDVFRTAFVGEGDQLHQLVCENAKLIWHFEDWSKLTKEQAKDKFKEYLFLDKAKGFDTNSAPLLRFAMFKLSETEYQFLSTHHHMLMDGWCLGIIYGEVMSIYQSLCHGQDPELTEPSSYESYIAWLDKQDNSVATDYWKNYLVDMEAPTKLPMDVAGEESVEFAYRDQSVSIDKVKTEQLKAFASLHGVTINTLLQFAWGAVLHAYSGDNEVYFGSTISGRPPELENAETIVGLFINSLPLKVSFSEDLPISDYLKALQLDFQSSSEKGFLSLVDIQGETAVQRDVQLFDSLMVFENYPFDEIEQSPEEELTHSIAISSVEVEEQTTFPMTLTAFVADEINISCKYFSNWFSPFLMEKMMANLHQALVNLLTCESLFDYQILTDEERNYLLSDLVSDTKISLVSETIHGLFERSAKLTPEAVAIEHSGVHHSYKALNEKSNQLARLLESQGIKKGDLIGICVERSADMVLSMLAILKIGAIFVSLDPEYPNERLGYMLQDCDIKLILTQATLSERVRQFTDVSLMPVDQASLDDSLADFATDNLTHITIKNSDLAYIVFTSGSTGRPKGVMQSHGTISNLVSAQSADGTLQKCCRTLQFTSFSFDVSYQEMATCWFTGSPLIILPEDSKKNLASLPREMKALHIERAFLPPTVFNLLAEELLKDEITLNELREVVVAGEALIISQGLRSYLEQNSQCQLINHYGPTETHLVSSKVVNLNESDQPSIGWTIPNVQCYILDVNKHLVPYGAAGELYVSGAQLAKGYSNNQSQTDERFVSNPFSLNPQEKMYRTGDLVRYMKSGELEYLGRADEQIKIRGFRVELGEIETNISQLTGVKNAVVKLSKEKQSISQLIGYVTLEKQTELPEQVSTDLIKLLKTRLPDYMVPKVIMPLESFPLTHNGKVDKTKLPEPSQEYFQSEYVPPSSDLEKQMTEIWSALLEIDAESISVLANFFELGGHSLLSVRLISELRRVFSIELSIREIFELNDLQSLCNKLSQLIAEKEAWEKRKSMLTSKNKKNKKVAL